MSVADRLEVRGKDKATLRRWVRSTAIPAGLARRARIVLLAGDGVPNAEIARRVAVSRPTVIGWRERYLEGGIAALEDRPRPGRAKQVDEAQIVVATLDKPPEKLGVTHWSSRLLGRELGLGHATVARVWNKWDLQPWRVETFKFSTDPELEAKVRDVVGLYLHPPENAVVLSCDEKSQVQALDRTQPTLPMGVGHPEAQTHDYVRHGTTTLFAALDVATGQVTGTCFERHRHQEFLKFLTQVAKAYPRVRLHVVCDNYATHKHPKVKAWLERNPRITLHFTPTSASWLNMVEIFFGIITRQAIRRGTFDSVRDLMAKIRQFIDGWNERCEPFTWTKDAGTILEKIDRKASSGTGH